MTQADIERHRMIAERVARNHKIEANQYGIYLPAAVITDYWEMAQFEQRWPSFSPEELASKGNGDLRIHYHTLDAMQKLRNMAKIPLIVHSYYRDPEYNDRVGGAPASRHMAGMAVDTPLFCTVQGRFTLIHLATLAGFSGFGFYDTFTHLDTGPHRVWGTLSAMRGMNLKQR